MKNPLRDLSRPKALGLAGLAAGALTVSAAAAAVNVGLLSAHPTPAFSPTPVVETRDSVAETTTTVAPVEVVYQDVYEQAPGAPASTASQPSSAPAAVQSGSGDGSDDTTSTTDSVDSPSDDDGTDDSIDDSNEVEPPEHEADDSADHETDDGGGIDD